MGRSRWLRAGRGGRRAGFTLAEIALSMLILGLALAPLFGVLTGGVVRTDISASYETATTIASSILNTLLSTSCPFQDLVDRVPTTAGQEHPGPSAQPGLLGDGGVYPDQYYHVGRVKYYTDLWIGLYNPGTPQDISFKWFQNPRIDFEADPSYTTDFYKTVVLSPAFYGGYSPYNPNATHLMDKGQPDCTAWASATAERTKLASAIADQGAPRPQMMKIILRIRWGKDDFTGSGGVRGGEKYIWFVTLKARLDGT